MTPDGTARSDARFLALPSAVREHRRTLRTVLPGSEITVPDVEQARLLLDQLGVASSDVGLVIADRPEHRAEVEIVADYARLLVERMGTFHHLPAWPKRDDFLYVWVFLAALPSVRAYHAAHDVPDDVSWASLADLGRAIDETRWRTSEPGSVTCGG